MTVSSSTNRIQYTGTGSVDTFSTGSIIFYDSSDLIVTETVIATGVDTVYTITTDYTVTGGGGAAGTVVLVAGNLPSTKRITIERSIPYTQSEDFKEGEAILVEEIETGMDKITIQVQQILDASERSIKLAPTSTASSIVLPGYSAGKVLGWSASTVEALDLTTFTIAEIDAAVVAVAALTGGSGVKVSANDTTVGFLNGKLVAGSGLSFTENNGGSNETLTVDVDINGQSSATIALNDEIIFGDVDDSDNLKKDTVQGIIDLVPVTKIVQVQSAVIAAATGTGNNIPADSTSPTSSEGTQIVTHTITPASASNTVEISASFTMSNAGGRRNIAAVFRGSVCVGAAVGRGSASGDSQIFTFNIIDSPSTTSVTTYTIRVGKDAGSETWYVNQMAFGTLGGEMAKQRMILKEVGA